MIAKDLTRQMLFRHIKLRVMLGVLLFIGQNVGAEQQITAEWVETLLKSSGSSRTYAGKVVFEDSLRALSVRADSAYVQGTTYFFVSNLLFEDSTRMISAKRLTYDEDKRFANFEGDVKLQDGQRTLSGQQIHVLPDSESVTAFGQVTFDFSDGTRRIQADKLEYGASNSYATAVGGVVASIKNKTDTLVIGTDSLRFKPEHKAFEFWGNAVVSQMGMLLLSQRGKYSERVLHTIGHPRLTWSQDLNADSMWAEADTIRALLQNDVLDTLLLAAHAEIHLSAQQDTSVVTYNLRGDNGVIDVVQESISQINMAGNACLGFERTGTFAKLPGDSIFVWFTNEKLDSILIVGDSEGTVRVKGKGSSRLLGKTKILWFEDDTFVRMRLEGHAVCQYKSLGQVDDGDVDVEGDLLELFFRAGELSQIKADGKVKGVYLQKKEARTP